MYSWNLTKNTSLVVTSIRPWAAKRKAVSACVRPRGNFRVPRLNGDGSQTSPFQGGPLQWDEEEPNSQTIAEDISSPRISVAVPGLDGDAAVELPPPPAPLPQPEPQLPNQGSGVADVGTYVSSYPTLSSDMGSDQNIITSLGLALLKDPGTLGGRLLHFHSNWEKLSQDPYILSIVKGMTIDWLQVPSQLREIPCPKFSNSQSNQLSTEVNKLVEKNAIEVTKPSPNQFVSHIFLASKKDGTNRPVINLKQLNKHVKYMHFKMEGIPNLVDLLQRDDHMCKLDLKDAYFVIPVAPRYQEYLKFRWNGVLYKFKVAPFGLGSVPRTFSKLMKAIIAVMRRSGIRCVIYLDDLILLHQEPVMLQNQLQMTISLLQNLGFIINWEKSVINPTRKIEYLGFHIDSSSMTMSLPMRKLKDLQNQYQKLLRKGQTSARQLAKIIGKMSAAVRAILPAPLQYRHLQRLKTQALFQGHQSYESLIQITPECKAELQWWIESVPQWNGRSVIRPSPDLSINITTDASRRGWGAHCAGVKTQGLWTPEEQKLHINALEIKAVMFAVKAFTKK